MRPLGKNFYEIKPEGYFFAQNALNSNFCNKVDLYGMNF